jgi:hypothetical protein
VHHDGLFYDDIMTGFIYKRIRQHCEEITGLACDEAVLQMRHIIYDIIHGVITFTIVLLFFTFVNEREL